MPNTALLTDMPTARASELSPFATPMFSSGVT